MRSKVRWRGGLMGLKAYHVDNEEWIYNMSANLKVERNTLSYMTNAAVRTICNKVRIYGRTEVPGQSSDKIVFGLRSGVAFGGPENHMTAYKTMLIYEASYVTSAYSFRSTPPPEIPNLSINKYGYYPFRYLRFDVSNSTDIVMIWESTIDGGDNGYAAPANDNWVHDHRIPAQPDNGWDWFTKGHPWDKDYATEKARLNSAILQRKLPYAAISVQAARLYDELNANQVNSTHPNDQTMEDIEERKEEEMDNKTDNAIEADMNVNRNNNMNNQSLQPLANSKAITPINVTQHNDAADSMRRGTGHDAISTANQNEMFIDDDNQDNQRMNEESETNTLDID